ncbi:MAG: hypothetical protein AB7L09_02105 [Nitrospira sp.]
MTFEQWWRENEAALAAEHYNGDRWVGIYQLLEKAFNAGVKKETGD